MGLILREGHMTGRENRRDEGVGRFCDGEVAEGAWALLCIRFSSEKIAPLVAAAHRAGLEAGWKRKQRREEIARTG